MRANRKLLCQRVSLVVRLAVVVAAFPVLVFQPALPQEVEKAPKVSETPLTTDQLAIYHTVLNGWMDDGKSRVYISNLTVPLDLDTDGCGKKAPDLEKADPSVVHRFRTEDVIKLGGANLTLVDREAQEKEVADNEPGKAIHEGKSVDEAVRNGFAHGLVTLSEIRFDTKHERAIVWYGFNCGSLCGNGGTVIMEKKNGAWTRKGVCSVWMARFDPSLPGVWSPGT